MEIKEFLKPTILKVIIFTISFIVFTFLTGGYTSKSTWGVGFPFEIYGAPFMTSQFPDYIFLHISPLFQTSLVPGIILNIIFWYIISIVLVLIYEKFRPNKK